MNARIGKFLLSFGIFLYFPDVQPSLFYNTYITPDDIPCIILSSERNYCEEEVIRIVCHESINQQKFQVSWKVIMTNFIQCCLKLFNFEFSEFSVG